MTDQPSEGLAHTAAVQACLFDVFEILAQPVELCDQLSRIHQVLFRLLDASNLYVAVYDPTSELYVFPYNADEDGADVAPQRLDDSLTDYVRRTGEPLLCDASAHEALAAAGQVAAAGAVGSFSPLWMGAPMVTPRGVIGVVVVQSYTNPTAYVPRDLQSLEMVARAMAHAVESATRRHQLEAEHAMRLQALELSRDEALAASAAKSTFLATMSHELRTPLTAILGYTELLEEELEDAGLEAGDDLGHIQRASQHLLRVISDILDLAKIESGQVEPSYRSVRVGDLVEQVLTLTAPLVEASGAELTVRATDTTTVHTDPDKLVQILTNLVANAAAHAGAGQITLRARVEGPPSSPVLRAEVSDTGSGIAAEQLPRLFRAFEQGDGRATRRQGGSGLGLAISRGFARLLGGDLVAASVPGMGSTFTVHLPTRPPGAPAERENG